MSDFAAYPFRIPELRPDTLPMARLAAYMADLARLLGSAEAVHFDRLEDGSLVLVPLVRQDAKPLHRLACGLPDAEAAWKTPNQHLTKDGATGELTLPGGEIIQFPGCSAGRAPYWSNPANRP